MAETTTSIAETLQPEDMPQLLERLKTFSFREVTYNGFVFREFNDMEAEVTNPADGVRYVLQMNSAYLELPGVSHFEELPRFSYTFTERGREGAPPPLLAGPIPFLRVYPSAFWIPSAAKKRGYGIILMPYHASSYSSTILPTPTTGIDVFAYDPSYLEHTTTGPDIEAEFKELLESLLSATHLA